jgi:hypothetical protein
MNLFIKTFFTKRTYREFYWRPRTIWSHLRRGRSVSHAVYHAKSALGLARFVYGKEAEVSVPRYGGS